MSTLHIVMLVWFSSLFTLIIPIIWVTRQLNMSLRRVLIGIVGHNDLTIKELSKFEIIPNRWRTGNLRFVWIPLNLWILISVCISFLTLYLLLFLFSPITKSYQKITGKYLLESEEDRDIRMAFDKFSSEANPKYKEGSSPEILSIFVKEIKPGYSYAGSIKELGLTFIIDIPLHELEEEIMSISRESRPAFAQNAVRDRYILKVVKDGKPFSDDNLTEEETNSFFFGPISMAISLLSGRSKNGQAREGIFQIPILSSEDIEGFSSAEELQGYVMALNN